MLESPRYTGDLIKYHNQIYSCIPHADKMHEEVWKVSREYFGAQNRNKNSIKVIEIGCGLGETTSWFIRNNRNNFFIEASDISKDMIEHARKGWRISEAVEKGKLALSVQDAFTYLPTKADCEFDAFVSSWTLHNFSNEQRKSIITNAYRILGTNGLFVCMDKMYDEKLSLEKMFHEQIKIYDGLDKRNQPEVKRAIIEHEKDDFKEGIRINRGEFIDLLRKVGFRSVWATKRIINDEVVCGIK